MDLWVVAAAAGAGYIAKNWHGLTGSSSQISLSVESESRSLLQQIRDKTCPLRRLARKRAQGDGISEEKNDFDVNSLEMDRLNGEDSLAQTSSSSSNAFENIERLEDHNGIICLTKLPPGYSAGERCGCDYAESSNFHSFSKKKIIRRCYGRPLNSLECSLDAQQCRKLEENVRIPSAPMFGSRIIRSLSSDLTFAKVQGARRENGAFLKQLESGNDQRFLFFVGMTIGIMSATATSKNEEEKLNEQLKQTENLVQDLQEELDMKETLTVKELANEGYQPHTPDDPSLDMNESIQYNSLKAINDKNTEIPELRSKIEAELEAELERLEHSMKLDPDFEPYTVQGDLKLAMAGENHNYTSESGHDTTETTTDCSQPANYAVSPWELSLRLHELIESRLEARIKELEVALENSEKQVQTLGGSHSIISQRTFFYSETESSSSPRSPSCINEHNTTNGNVDFALLLNETLT